MASTAHANTHADDPTALNNTNFRATAWGGLGDNGGAGGNGGRGGRGADAPQNEVHYRTLDVDEYGNATPISSSEYTNFANLTQQPIIIAGSSEKPYTNCINVDMDMCGNNINYTEFGTGSNPSSGSSCTRIQYENTDSDLDFQATGIGRKTPEVGSNSYAGFNLLLNEPEEISPITGEGEVCPGEEDYCIDYFQGYFYNWSIVEGDRYASIVSDPTFHCISVEFTNTTDEPQTVILHVDVSPPCCPSYKFEEIEVTVLPNVRIIRSSRDMLLCEGDDIRLFVESSMPYPDAQYEWLLNGNPVPGDPMAEGDMTSNLTLGNVGELDAGTYTVIVSGACNVETVSFNVSLNPSPVVTVSLEDDAVICTGWSIPLIFYSNMDNVTVTFTLYGETYSWLLHEGENYWEDLYDENEYLTAPQNGVLTIISAQSGDNGCVNTDVYQIPIILANGDEVTSAGADRTYCANQFTLEAVSPNTGSTGHWSIVSVNPADAAAIMDDPTNYLTDVTVDQEGEYTFEWVLEMYDPCPATIRDTVVINVKDSIRVGFVTDPTSCFGEPVDAVLEISGGEAPYTAYWLVNDSVMGVGDEWTGLEVGYNYSVIVDDINECSTTFPFTVVLLESQTLAIQNIDTVCPNATEVDISVGIDQGATPFTIVYTYGGVEYPYTGVSGHEHTATLPVGNHACYGVDTVYLSVTDANGCNAQDTTSFIITDVHNPILTGTIPDTTITCLSELPAAVSNVAELLALMGEGAAITDNCSNGFSLTSVTDDISATCHVTYHRTYTVADSCGNTVNIIQNIIFNDEEDPEITGTLANDTVYAASDCGYVLPTAFTTVAQLVAAGVAISDCNLVGEVSYVDNSNAPVSACATEIIRTYTVSDSCGNSTNVPQTIVVIDTVAPQITTILPSDTTYYNNNCGHDEIQILDKSDFQINDCNEVEMTVSHRDTSNNGTGCEWSYVRVYSFVDACGNGPVEVLQTITVMDTTRPVVAGHLNDTILYYSGNDCSLADIPVLPQSSFTVEDCNEVEMTVSHRDTSNNGTGCEWSYVRVYSFVDACGNGPVEVLQTITVRDTTRPAIANSLDDITIYKQPDCSYLLPDTLDVNGLVAAGIVFTDCNLRLDTIAVTHSSFETTNNCQGTLIRTYEVFDQCGNSNTLVQNIIVQDTARPVVVDNLADTLVVYYTDAECAYTAPEPLQLTDFDVTDCSPQINFEVSHRDTTNNGEGCEWSYVQVYTFTDDCGNAPVTLFQTIVVRDTTSPIVSHTLEAVTIYRLDNCTYQLPDTLDVEGLVNAGLEISDCNLNTDRVGVSHSDYMADDNCAGHIVRTYEIFDLCGNSTTTEQTINITDSIRPYFTAEIPEQLLVSTSCEFVIPDLSDTVLRHVADNCTDTAQIVVTQQIPAAGTPTDSEQDVVVTISDLCGNTNTITVHVTLPEPLTVEITLNDTAICEGQSVTLTTAYEGGVEPYTYSWMPTSGLDDALAAEPVATPEDGTYRYVVTLTDGNGCTATDTVNVEVDTLPADPVLSSLPDVACTGGHNGSITIESPLGEGYSYALNGADFQDTAVVYTGLGEATYTVTVQISAAAGCTSTGTVVVERSPEIPAVLVDTIETLLCPSQGEQELSAHITGGLAPITVTWSDNVTQDVNDSLHGTIGITAGACDTSYTVTVYIMDANNCSTDNTYTFYVVDTTAPVMADFSDTIRIEGCTAEVAPAEWSSEQQLTDAGISYSDACTNNGDFTVSCEADTTGSCPITITRRYYVTDACGNRSNAAYSTILINDETAPAVTVSTVTTELNACGEISAPAEATTAAALRTLGFDFADLCTSDDDLTVNVTADTTATSCPKVITRHYTVTDECDNTSAEMIHTISIFDSVAPVISGTAETLVLYSCDSSILSFHPAATTVAQLLDLNFTIEEACTYDEMVVHHTVDSVGSCPIVITRSYWVTDGCENVSNTVTHTITIGDTSRPTWNEAVTDTLLVSQTCEFVVPDFVAIAAESAGDNCTHPDDIRIVQSVDAGTPVTSAMEVTVTLTDVCDNSNSYTIQVRIPDTLTVEITLNDTAVCEGQSVNLPTIYEGGVETYTYQWTPEAGLDDASASAPVATPAAGIHHYVVTLTDGNGCTATDTVVVEVDTLPAVPTMTSLPDVACQGGHNGSFTITAPVGTGYSYALDGADFQDTSNVYTGLSDGTYTVTVQTSAAAGCTSTGTVTVERSPEIPDVAVDTIETLLCPGQGVQELSAQIMGGLAPINVTWSENVEQDVNDSLQGIISIVAGACDTSYTVTVYIRDANNCTTEDTYTFYVVDTTAPVMAEFSDTLRIEGCSAAAAPAELASEAELLAAEMSFSDACTAPGNFLVSCEADTTGSCPVVITRNYYVSDACGNRSNAATMVIEINDETAPVVSAITIDTLIEGCDVSAAVPEVTTAAGLEAIGFTIEDACTENADMTVSVAADTNGTCPTVITRRYVVADLCNNVSDTMRHIIRIKDTTAPVVSGTLAVVEVEGCDYTALSEYPIAQSWQDLSAASYATGVTLTEACTDSEDLQLRCEETRDGDCPTTVTRKYVLEDLCHNISDTLVHLLKFDDNTAPYFTQEIADQVLVSGNCVFTMPDLTDTIRRYIADNCTSVENIIIAQNIDVDQVLTETQTVTITITDACGNSYDTTLTVAVPQPLSLSVMLGDTSVCEGASVVIPTTISGGVAPYTYAWEPTEGLSDASADTVTATPAAGTYSYMVTVTDANGCTDTDGMTLQVDTIPAVPTLSMSPNTICVGQQNGSITVENPVGDGYYYSLNNAGYQDTASVYNNLETGDYTVTVKTEEGCVSQPATIHVDNSQELPTVNITHIAAVICPNAGTQAMEAVVTGGEAPFTYTWTGAEEVNDSITTVNIDPTVCDSAYLITIQVVDANNCTSTDMDTLYVRDTVRPTISGTYEPITYNGCSVDDAPVAVTTLDGLSGLGLTYSDNCTELSDEVSSRQEVVGNCPKEVRRYYTITDACHLVSDEYLHVLYVFDSVAPDVTMDEITTHLNACDESSAPAVAVTSAALQQIGFTFSDNCTATDELLVESSADTASSCPIVLTRKYVVKDSCGNTSDTMTHIITIFDSIAPVINGTIAEVTVDGCDTTVLRSYPMATDAVALEALGVEIVEQCSDVTVHYTEIVAGSCPIVVTRTYSVEDACENISNEVQQVINIQDTTRPDFRITLVDSTLVSDNCTFEVPDYVEIVMNTLYDNCTPTDELTVHQTPLAGEAVTNDTVVTITAIDGCGNTNTISVAILMPTIPELSTNLTDTAICQGNSVTLISTVTNGTAPYGYEWTVTPTSEIADPDGATVTVTPEDETTYVYTVSVTDANGCSASVENIRISVYETPSAAETETTPNTVCTGTPNGTITVTSPANDEDHYLYSLNGGNYQFEPLFENLASGDYTLTVMTEDGCSSETVTVHVSASQELPSVSITAETQVLCPIAGDQTVSATIEGGEGPFEYQWHGDATGTDDEETATVAIDETACDSVYSFYVSITDANQCVDTARAVITVLDNTAPEIHSNLDTVWLFGCSSETTLPDVLTSAYDLAEYGCEVSDNCVEDIGDLILTLTSTQVTEGCPVRINRTYLLSDLCGNVSDSIRETIIITDNTPPSVQVASVEDTINGCTAEDAPAVAGNVDELAAIGFVFSDECGTEMTVSVSADTSNTHCPLVITRHYTVADHCGNTSEEMVHTIRIVDRIAPVVSGTIDTVTLDGCGLTAMGQYPMAEDIDEFMALGNFSITENCSSDAVVLSSAIQEESGSCPMIVTRTYTVEDACGNVSNEITQVFRIQDTMRPDFHVTFADSTVTSTDCEFVVPDYVTLSLATLSDNCTDLESLTVTQSPLAGTPISENTTVTITAEDECGNSSVQTVTVSIPSTPSVTITQNDTSFCQGGSVVLGAVVENGVPDYTYLWSPADGLSATDVNTVVASPAAGNYTYEVTVHDANGCETTAQVQVIVHALPETPETLTSDNTLCAGGYNGSIAVLSPIGSGYQYSLDGEEYQTSTVFSELQEGTYTVFVMSPDGCVSEASTVEVGVYQDVPAVTILGPDSIICPNAGVQTVTAVITGGTEPFVYTWTGTEPTPGIAQTAVISPVVNACDTLYIFSVEIEDVNHCTNSVTDTIVVRDLELPTIEGELAVVTYNGCGVEVLPAAARTAAELTALGLTVTDNCTPLNNLVVAHRDVSDGTCPIVVHRYYTVTDGCGNMSAEFMQTLQVFDSVAPDVTVPIIETALNGCDVSVADAVATTPNSLQEIGFAFHDECTEFANLQVLYEEQVDGSCPIVITRKYRVTDACGNVSDTMTHTITVFDSVAPQLNGTIAEITIDGCDTTVLQNYPVALTEEALLALGVTVDEDCSDVTVTYTQTVTGECPIVVTRTYMVEDACGNVSNEVTQVINIQDTTSPYFTSAVDTQYLAGSGGNFFIPDFSTMISFIIDDNCTPVDQINIEQTPAANTQVNQNQTVTVTISDGCDNSSSMDIEVVVPDMLMIDIIQPDSRFCFGDSISLTPMVYGGTPDFIFTWTPADGLSATDVQDVTAAPAPGTYHYVVTVVDANGSTASDSVTVIVDSIPATPQLAGTDNSACNGDPTGVVTVTAPLGEGYTYSLNGGEYQTQPSFTGLGAGTYTVMVQTAAGCTSEAAEISLDNTYNMPTVTLVAPDTLLCPNIGTQEITAEITGGTEPFNISWSGEGVQTSATATTVVNVDAAQCDRMYVITFELTDAGNCYVSATDTIRVSDDVVPTIAGTIETVTYNGCTADDAPAAVTTADGLIALGLTLDDNCTPASELAVTHRDVVDGSCPMVISRYYKVTDLCGNVSAEFMQTLQVFDSVAPSVTINAVETHLSGCDATAADAAATTSQALQSLGFDFNDVCTALASLTVAHTESVDGTCPTTIIRKYVVTDACGNVSDTMTHTITIFDSIAPVISGIIADAVLNGCDTTVLTQRPAATTVEQLLALGGITIEEACSGENMTLQSSQTVTVGCPITVVRTYTVTDLCGNESNEVTETILIQDTVSPVFAEQLAEHLLVSDNCQFVVPDLTEEVREVSSDNCTTDAADLVIAQNPAAGTSVTADMIVAVTVSDACENSAVMNIQLRLPETITLSVEPSTTEYCEWDTVALSAIPVGGDGEYSYEWTPATGLISTTDSIVQVVTENQHYEYSVIVTDGNGCTATVTYTLPEPSHLTATAVVQSGISCFEGSDGVALAAGSGGAESYTYEWNNGATDAQNNGLAEGTYSVTVTDAYGCTATAEVEFTHPEELTATVSDETAVLCFGDANGSGMVTPDGGTAPYTVSIDNNVTTYDVAAGAGYTFTQLTAGTYIVLVTDANGCQMTDTLTVTSPEQLQMTAGTITMPLCHQGDDGNAIVNVTGGTLPYVLVLNETEITMDAAGDQQIDNLSAGTYTVTATDANGCVTQVSFTVNEPDLLTLAQVSVVNVSCNGLSDATATVTFAGGTAPFTLYIDGNQQETTAAAVQNVTFTDLAAGTHTVGIRDANGCVTTLPVSITEPAVLAMTAGNIVDVLCFGDANGSAVVTPTGGTAPYTISVDDFTTTQTVAAGATGTFANLTAGDYTAAVRDANGCEATVDFTIGTPTALEMTEVSTTDPLCYQDANGSIVVNLAEGTAPYSLTVNGAAEATNLSAGDYTVANRAAGTYTIVVTDANGCTATVTSVLEEPAQLTLTEADTTPITCFGGDDGTATVSVAGGTAGYTIWMDDNLQTQTITDATEQVTFTGINGGDHVFTATDAHNCQTTLTLNFREPDPMSTVVDSLSNVLCYGQSNGTATVTISGGTVPYILTVADDIPEITLNTEDPYMITGLDEGVYTISIVDDHGCTAQMEVTIQQPDSLSAIASVLNNVDCFGTLTGAATVLPEGGTPPYTYTWTGDKHEQTVDSLAAGSYFVTVTDANGCSATDSTDISEPDELTVNLITLTESCNGEETAIIEVEAHGGTPEYSFIWSNGMEGEHLDNLAVGPYTVTLTDQHNCFDTMTVVVPFHPMPDFTVSVTPAYCGRADGTATVVGDNLNAYSYNWNTTPNPDAPMNDELTSGDYTLVVDDGVCTLVLPFTIDAVPGPTANFTADPTEFILGYSVHFNDHSYGSIATWEYDFGDGGYASQQSAIHEYMDPGTYWTVLTVTDQHNCVDTASVLITVIPDVIIYVPNAFTPNDDGINDIWLPIISNNGDAFYEVLVYSRWGELIFRSNDPNVGWNGKHNGKLVEAGVFTYKITYGDYFNKKYQKTGTVTVVR